MCKKILLLILCSLVLVPSFASGVRKKTNKLTVVKSVSTSAQLVAAIKSRDAKKVLALLGKHNNVFEELSQKRINSIFSKLAKANKHSAKNNKILKMCLDDQDFCDGIQDSTLKNVLGFVERVFAGDNRKLGKAVEGVLEIICDQDDLEDRIFDICEQEGYPSILKKLEDGQEDDSAIAPQGDQKSDESNSDSSSESESEEEVIVKKRSKRKNGKKKDGAKKTKQSSKDCGLFSAVIARNAEKVKKILDERHGDLSEAAINEAFVKTVTGRREKLRLKVTPVFLSHQKVKELLSGKSLDKVVVKLIYQNKKDLFSIILRDEVLRKKLYTNTQTREFFDKALNLLAKRNSIYLKEFLSYPDLREKIKHLDCITQKMLGEVMERELLVDEEVSSGSLVDALNARDTKQMKKIFECDFDSIEPMDLNYVFIACLYQKYFEGIKTLLSCATFRKYLAKGCVPDIFEILNDCLLDDDEQYQEIAKKIIDQMCGYKKLKKRVLELIKESDFEALKTYCNV